MNRLKEFRQNNQLTQKEMALKLGVTLSMYEKVESGRTGVSFSFMKKIKTAFPDISIDFLFFAPDSNIFAILDLKNDLNELEKSDDLDMVYVATSRTEVKFIREEGFRRLVFDVMEFCACQYGICNLSITWGKWPEREYLYFDKDGNELVKIEPYQRWKAREEATQ